MSDAAQQAAPEPLTPAENTARFWADTDGLVPEDPRYRAARAKFEANIARAPEPAPAPIAPELEVPADIRGYGISAEHLFPGATEEQAAELNEGLAIFRELGLSRADVRAGESDYQRMEHLAKKGEDIAADAERVLRGTWGSKYDQNLAAVRSFVQANPRLAAWLDSTGMGNSPQLAAALLRAAQRKGGR